MGRRAEEGAGEERDANFENEGLGGFFLEVRVGNPSTS